jgi:hypothetical protein
MDMRACATTGINTFCSGVANDPNFVEVRFVLIDSQRARKLCDRNTIMDRNATYESTCNYIGPFLFGPVSSGMTLCCIHLASCMTPLEQGERLTVEIELHTEGVLRNNKMSTFETMQATPIYILTPTKKRLALQKQQSETEKLKESSRIRKQESSVRKAAIHASLGKWDSFDLQAITGKDTSTTKEGETLNKPPMRRKSVEEVLFAAEKPDKKPSSIRSKSQDSSARANYVSPGGVRKRASEKVGTNKDESNLSARVNSASPGAVRRRVSEKVGTNKDESDASPHIPKMRSSKIKRPSSRKLEKLLGNVTGKKSRGGGGASVASAPSELQPDHSRSAARPARRGSRAPKSSNTVAARRPNTLAARRPRRTKSSDLTSVAETTKKLKRRAKSADADDNFAQEQEDELQKSDKSGRTKRRPSKKKSGASEASTTDNSTEIDSEQDQERSVRRERRRAMPAGTKKPLKRAHSVGPIKRNEEVRDRPERILPSRAASMMLNRDTTRRGKSESLSNLVQYSQEEIHSTSYFASNHVLVNRERMKRGLRPLTRNIAMDTLARDNAEAMAGSAGCSPLKTTYVGNVLRGESIRAVHRATMLNKEGRERANLLNPYFQDFGVGTAKGEDGMLYVCQLFSERLELSCTDAVDDQAE